MLNKKHILYCDEHISNIKIKMQNIHLTSKKVIMLKFIPVFLLQNYFKHFN